MTFSAKPGQTPMQVRMSQLRDNHAHIRTIQEAIGSQPWRLFRNQRRLSQIAGLLEWNEALLYDALATARKDSL